MANNQLKNAQQPVAIVSDGTNWIPMITPIFPPSPPPTLLGPDRSIENGVFSSFDKLRMRLRLMPGESFDVDYLAIFEGATKAFLFIVHNDEPVFIEDDIDMFPSDGLIAKYRLLQDKLRNK